MGKGKHIWVLTSFFASFISKTMPYCLLLSGFASNLYIDEWMVLWGLSECGTPA